MSSTERPVIIGVDEAGRGPLAGPVIAAACVLLKQSFACPVTIADGKLLTPEQREDSFAWLSGHCSFGIGMSSHEEIDSIGIVAATEKAMQMAVAELEKHVKPEYILIDGRDGFWFDYPHSSIIRGDRSEWCISAASIIAKVTRDRFMIEQSKIFPEYAFHEHKGYGTPEHLKLLKKHGPCALHRRRFLRGMCDLHKK